MRAAILTALFLLAPGAARAAEGAKDPDRHRGFFVGANVGYHQPIGADYDGDYSSGLGHSIEVGTRFAPFIDVAVTLSQSYTDVAGIAEEPNVYGSEGLIQYLGVSAHVYPLGAASLEPVIGAGVAPGTAQGLPLNLAQAVVGEQTTSGYAAWASAGVKLWPMDTLWVGLEARYVYLRYTHTTFGGGVDFPREQNGDLVAAYTSIGLQF